MTLVLGIDNALAWREAPERLVLVVMFAVLVGGVAGELLGIERRLHALGDRLQARFAGAGRSSVSGSVQLEREQKPHAEVGAALAQSGNAVGGPVGAG